MEVTTITSVENSNVLKTFPQLTDIKDTHERYRKHINTLADKFEKLSSEYEDDSKLLDGFSQEMENHFKERSPKNSFLYEFSILYERHTLITMRNPQNFVYKIFHYVISAIIFAIIISNVIMII